MHTDFIRINDEEFHQIAKLVRDKFGINLQSTKLGLVESRLNKELKKRNLQRFKDYFEIVEADKSGVEVQNLANLISTNHTFFNRENSHFKFLKEKVLPEICKSPEVNRRKDLRIWCAASSTGEEPIMLMIQLLEYFGIEYSQWSAGLLATDISLEVLAKAKKGEYEEGNLKNLSAFEREKYFEKISGEKYKVINRVLKEITYARYNLVTGSYQFSKQFNVIFCRNVMIYFDNQTKEQVINNMYKCLTPGGYLFIGHAESLNGLNHQYENIIPAVYRK